MKKIAKLFFMATHRNELIELAIFCRKKINEEEKLRAIAMLNIQKGIIKTLEKLDLLA